MDFENDVINSLTELSFPNQKRKSYSNTPLTKVQYSRLKFSSLKSTDPTVRIQNKGSGYEVKFNAHKTSYIDLKQIFSAENETQDFVFEEEYLNFTPDDTLIKKSTVPLWVIKPLSSNKVYIQRAWA